MARHIQNGNLDYLFVGAGASATLMLMRMEQHGLLNGKNILILDPDDKLNNDKTYCFWTDQNDQLALGCAHLISHQWEKVRVNQNQQESLLPQKYFHISSLDLYNDLRRIVQKYSIKRLQQKVLAIRSIENGLEIITESENWKTSLVFDSRPSKYLAAKEDEVHLLQSFIGYIINTEKPIAESDCADLMDFNVSQLDATQFMYVLPLGEGKTLVELTRFGLRPISLAEADPILDDYILKRFGAYKLLNTETGCIPMSTAQISNDTIPGLISIGSRAGAIKPSTGYAFKNMFNQASYIANCLANKQSIIQKKKARRFKFYDRILLLIMSRKPYLGKPIFQALFNKNEIKMVLKFLDEKTTLIQDVKIFSSLPILPFLSAAAQIVALKTKRLLAPFALMLIAFFLWVVFKNVPSMFSWIQFPLFIGVMFLIGIPHGAVDHLLEKNDSSFRLNRNFVLKYVGLAFLNFVLWLLLPKLALLFFLVYSAWHFGETDLKEWKPQIINHVKIILWGSFILGIILLGHVNETNAILGNMQSIIIPISSNNAQLLSLILVTFGLIWAVLERRWQMLHTIIVLLICMELPLITAFGLYFIGQHSYNGWSHLKQGMNENNQSLFLKALPFTAGALIMFVGMALLMKNDLIHYRENWISIFFVFISCISFPHIIAMNNFYRKNSLQ